MDIALSFFFFEIRQWKKPTFLIYIFLNINIHWKDLAVQESYTENSKTKEKTNTTKSINTTTNTLEKKTQTREGLKQPPSNH